MTVENISIFKRVNSKRTFEDIADQIKDLVYSKTLKPKDRLPSERELSVLFGTGRMTVREALRILEASSFVYIRPGAEGGTFVRELDSTGMTRSISDLIKVGNITVEELTEARISIESVVIESIISRITKKELAAIEENIKQSEDFYGQRNKSNKAWDNKPLINFHVLLAEMSQNSLNITSFSGHFNGGGKPEVGIIEGNSADSLILIDQINSLTTYIIAYGVEGIVITARCHRHLGEAVLGFKINYGYLAECNRALFHKNFE